VEIEPVIAYGSYQDFQQEQLLHPGDAKPPADNLCPYALFGWEFFVPDDTDAQGLSRLCKRLRNQDYSSVCRQGCAGVGTTCGPSRGCDWYGGGCGGRWRIASAVQAASFPKIPS
jgi:hypothetical protein